MEYRPRLREHVRLVQHEGTFALIDPVIRRRLEIEPLGVAFVERLDGRTLPEALIDPDDQTLFRRLLLLNFIDGAGDDIVAQVAQLRSGERELGISILDGARFQCQGSGECCQNYVFGPLAASDVEKLLSLDLESAFPALSPPYIDEIQSEDGRKLHYLRSVNDRCVFLEDDKRCGLHRNFGADSKPKLCRLYPLEFVPTVDGLRLYDKGSCATYAVSSRSGLPLVDDFDRVRALLPETTPDIYHPVVRVDEYPCDFGHFDRFAKASMKLVKVTKRNGPDTLRAISRGLRHFAQSLREFPLTTGQPDAAIDELLSGDLARWYEGEPPTAEVKKGAYHLSEVFSALLVAVFGAIGRGTKEKGYMSERLLREAAQLFHVAGALAMHVAEPDLPLDPYFDALVRIPVAGADIDDVMRLSLRQQLFSLDCLVQHHALAGLIRMGLSQVITVAGARVRAVNNGQSEATSSDLSWGHMLAARVLRRDNSAPVVLAAEQHFSAILEAIPAVVGLA